MLQSRLPLTFSFFYPHVKLESSAEFLFDSHLSYYAANFLYVTLNLGLNYW